MASKTKMRCNTCGKWFQSANAKDTTCQACTQKARKEKLEAKSVPSAPIKVAASPQAPPPPKPKPKDIQGGTNQWLDKVSDVKVADSDQPTRPKIPFVPTPREPRGTVGQPTGGDGNGQEERANGPERNGNSRGPNAYRGNTEYRLPNSPYRVGGGHGLPDTTGPRPRQPMVGGFNRAPRTEQPDRPPQPVSQGGSKFGKPKKTLKPPPEPRPKREKIEPPKPFAATTEQIAQIEARYLELATPIEFDGIRTQIAQELAIPKTAVKKIIKDLRDRRHIPSWWETQAYRGNEEDMAKIKVVYEPFLPLPNIGVHREIAASLSLKAGEVYQAIKYIRAELGLPQYNPPELHGLTLEEVKKQHKAVQQENVKAAKTAQAEAPKAKAAQEEAPKETAVPVTDAPTDTAKGEV